jgi:phosphotransferase system enzyme I (PtsI)
MDRESHVKDQVFKGLSISSGKVVAQVCMYSATRHYVVVDRTLGSDEDILHEVERYDTALHSCSEELDRIHAEAVNTIGTAEAEIFLTQKHIMNDPTVVAAIKKRVHDDRRSLEMVISQVYGEFEEKFSNLDNEYLRERSTDIGEIRRRLLDRLNNTRPGFVCQGQGTCRRGKDRVIVAEELTAEMMTHMRLESVLGIITERGGISSHAAIIARSLGVPAVSGLKGLFAELSCGTEVLVDGDEGIVVIEPSEASRLAHIPIESVDEDTTCAILTPPGMEVLANASLIDDVKQAAFVQADGIGLFRTELLFMRAERLLSETEQYELYSEAMDVMGKRPVVFRLLDVGGDKELPFLRIQKEDNPYLGWRGARFLLGSPEVFAAQVRALVRLSRRGKVGILVPMIIDSGQMARIVTGIRDVMATEDIIADNIRLGAMFEVPSAFLDADAIFNMVDFGSIGSNDLIQYLFAVDRNNENVSYDYNPDHPILWNVLQGLSSSAKRTGKHLSICGEMAGRRNAPSRLVDLGITSLSVSPRLVPRVRNELARRASLAHAANL